MATNYVKHKRKLIGTTSVVMGFIFSHYYTENVAIDKETNKFKPDGTFSISLQLRFLWLGSHVDIHSNTDEIESSYKAYVTKIELIKKMAQEALDHLTNGKGPLVIRNFLNDASINDGFGATLFITIDPDDRTNYCIFEISSCYKKYRYGTPPVEMKKYLKELIAFIDIEQEDLSIIGEKIKTYMKDK